MATEDKWLSDATPDLPVGKVARRALKLRLNGVVHYVPLAAFLAHEDIEHIHAARVNIRRSTAALALYREFVPKRARKRMKDTLKSLRTSMGDARDLDVYIKRFKKSADPASKPLLEVLKQQREEAQSPIIKCATPLLVDQKLRRRVGELVEATREHAPQELRALPYGVWATDQLRHQWEEFVAGLPGDDPPAEELHEFRIIAKRFRYAVELLSNGLPGCVEEHVYPQVKKLQSKLGAIQDRFVAAEKLAEWKQLSKDHSVKSLLAQLEEDERQQYRTTCEEFSAWWRRDRINELRDAVEALWSHGSPMPTATADAWQPITD